ncbi:hypothetical protein EDC16_102261 [Testudinibacter aquarius]|uniref:Uncharacterized protein n=1 Tax=Testudinibacter aquarius TaxID=1524974 RepID=A0A4R3YES7_9PAST|nr:hypothetical protein EDC16_102261 [Testudinibacter aquarius]
MYDYKFIRCNQPFSISKDEDTSKKFENDLSENL